MNTEKIVFNKLFKDSNKHKARFSRKKKTELALGDNLQNEIDKVNAIYEKTYQLIDDSFTPIRQIEKLMSDVNADLSINEYVDALQNLEEIYNIETDKLRQAENELGVSIPRPTILDTTVKQIEKFQTIEEEFRKDLNEYNGYLKMLFS